MTARPRVGLLGGTFDPIHLGHTSVATIAGEVLDLQTIRFIPSARPPHRPDVPAASAAHRLEMIRLAIAACAPTGPNVARWEASDVELRRDGPSYSSDTLEMLQREGLTPSQIFFIIGADAFAEIATWRRFPAVLELAHFAVVARPGSALDDLRERLPDLTSRMIRPSELATAAAPRVIVIDAVTPDISATTIRRLASRSESLDGLVTPAVASYIAQHSLYRGAPHRPGIPFASAPGV